MFTDAYEIAVRPNDIRRTTQVLAHESAKPIEYEAKKQDDGFYVFNFPGVDEYDFKDIVILLKKNGITTIGADEQLTEKKIMKLADLIRENTAPLSSDASGIIESLKKILQVWETKQYPDDKTRWEEYYMDIEELVQDIEEEAWLDAPSINEQILRKIIRDEFEKLT